MRVNLFGEIYVEPIDIAKQIVENNWTVRDVETMFKNDKFNLEQSLNIVKKTNLSPKNKASKKIFTRYSF